MKRIYIDLTPLYYYIVAAVVAGILEAAVNFLFPRIFSAFLAGYLIQIFGCLLGVCLCLSSFLFPLRRRSSHTKNAAKTLPIQVWGPILLSLVFLSQAAGNIAEILEHTQVKIFFLLHSGILYSLQYPLLLIMLLLIPMHPYSKNASTLVFFDSLMIIIALSIISWYFFLGPIMLAWQVPWSTKLVGATYPFGDLVLICCFLILSSRSGDYKIRATKWLFLLGLLIMVLGDSASEYQALQGSFSSEVFQTVSINVSYTVLSISSYFMRFIKATPYKGNEEKRVSEEAENSTPPFWFSLLPYTFIPVILLLLIALLNSHRQGVLEQGVYIGSIILLFLIVLRQVIALWETTHYAHRLHRANRRLESLTTIDPLTELMNHRALVSTLDQELARCKCDEYACSLLFLDLDHFKALNDGYGHAVGDAVLCEFGHIIQETLRDEDRVGRWGGEEFIVILPLADEQMALTIAERIRNVVSVHSFAVGGGLYLTCSIGIACYPIHALDRETLISAADQAMYGAKRLGRNQIRSISETAILALLTDDVKWGGREETALMGTMSALVQLVDIRDADLGEHVRLVSRLACLVARELGVSEVEINMLSLAGQLHDIGKIAIPDAILHKPGQLTKEEWLQMKTHARVGAEVISHIPSLRPLAPIIRAHHERWDGTGYPDQLFQEYIPFGARVIAVVDAYAVMIIDRPYQRARGHDEALIELRRCSGSQFDPRIVDALEHVLQMQQDKQIVEMTYIS